MAKLFLVAAAFAVAATGTSAEDKKDELVTTLDGLIARLAKGRADSFNHKAVLSDDDKLYTCSILAEPPLRISPVKAENSIDSVPRLVSVTLGVSNGSVDCEAEFPNLQIENADLHYKIDTLDFLYLMSVTADKGVCKLGLESFKIVNSKPVNLQVQKVAFESGAKTLADPINPKLLSSLNDQMIEKLREYMIARIEAVIASAPFPCPRREN